MGSTCNERILERPHPGRRAYTPGEQPAETDVVKLNTNENPYPPSESVIRAIGEETANLRLYPDPDATAVRAAAAGYYNDTLNLQARTG